MYSWRIVYSAILFFVLTPGILLTLPKDGSKFAVAATHALIFAVVLYFTRSFVEEFYVYTVPVRANNSSPNNCFPASAFLTVDDGSASGKKTQMSDLKIGDKVLAVDSSTGAISYSDIYLFGHRNSEIVANYYTVTTASGKSLQLSPEHYMYVSENGCNDSITTATTLSPNFVKVGMAAWIHTSEGMKCSAIVDIRQGEEKGLYNPFTLNGSIIVNGMHASCYSVSKDIPIEKFLSTFMNAENVARSAPAAWHTVFAPFRTLYLNNGPEWATRVTRPYDVDGWEDLSVSAITSTMIKESLVTA